GKFGCFTVNRHKRKTSHVVACPSCLEHFEIIKREVPKVDIRELPDRRCALNSARVMKAVSQNSPDSLLGSAIWRALRTTTTKCCVLDAEANQEVPASSGSPAY